MSRDTKAPDIVWAGPIITTPGGYPFTNPRYTASGQDIVSPEEGASLVDQLADNYAGIIKIALERGFYEDEGWPVLSLDEVRAITEQAHTRGLLVTAHVTGLDELRLAIEGGVDNLAHTPLEAMPDDIIQEMVGRDMGIVTTATIWDPVSALVVAENARAFADAGGRVSIGTDFGCCGQFAGIDAFLREMQFLQETGMAPAQLLTAATRGGAEVSNVGATTGTIEPGKSADLLVLNADPLADLTALTQVSTVIKAGAVVISAVS